MACTIAGRRRPVPISTEKRVCVLLLAMLAAWGSTGQAVPAQAQSDPKLATTGSSIAVPLSPAAAPRVCLPSDLKAIIQRQSDRGRDIETCELPCLARPPNLDATDAKRIERRYAVQWCRSCVPIGGYLPVDDIHRIEQAGKITLCPQPVLENRRRASGPSSAPGSGFSFGPSFGPSVVADGLKGVRGLFGSGPPSAQHDNFAVVISLTRPATRATARSRRDAAAMMALLRERSGYKSANVIDVPEATRADLERMFGDGAVAKGQIAARMREAAGARLFVYIAGYGAIPDEAEEAVLLGSGAATGRADAAYFPLDRLYRALAELKGVPATVILEVSFERDPMVVMTGLNTSESDVATVPKAVRTGLVVMLAAERDQRPLEDVETGLSLFTRHIIEGLGGAADVAPVGNGDGGIDTSELFVYAANRTGYVARKSYGLLQRPWLVQGGAQVLRTGEDR